MAEARSTPALDIFRLGVYDLAGLVCSFPQTGGLRGGVVAAILNRHWDFDQLVCLRNGSGQHGEGEEKSDNGGELDLHRGVFDERVEMKCLTLI